MTVTVTPLETHPNDPGAHGMVSVAAESQQ
jgi:hypothetical protein